MGAGPARVGSKNRAGTLQGLPKAALAGELGVSRPGSFGKEGLHDGNLTKPCNVETLTWTKCEHGSSIRMSRRSCIIRNDSRLTRKTVE